MAQPAVSEQIRNLEAELGVTLLNRTQRNVSLTPSGATLLEEASRVLRQADVAARAARGAKEKQLGRLRVGYLADALPASIPRALTAFGAPAPGIECCSRVARRCDLRPTCASAHLTSRCSACRRQSATCA